MECEGANAVRRLSPYLIIVLLVAAPFVTAALFTQPAVYAGPPQQGEEDEPVTPIIDFGEFVINIRLDLELLADEYNGPNIRPEGWTGNDDPASPSILGDIWLDLEAQADEVIGEPGARPIGWAGANSPTPERIARNLRHDLEVLANLTFGLDERPDDWIGADPIFSCDITVQNLVDTMARTFEFQPTTLPSVLNYCQAVVGEAQDRLALEGVQLVEGDIPLLLENIRGDMNRLTDELYGLGESPLGYLNTITLETNRMAQDLLADIELVADDKFGEDNRPPNWIGEIGRNPGTFVRNLRHDLEILADITLEGRDYLPNGRPEGWSGTAGFGDELSFCSTGTQTLILLMQQYYRYAAPEVQAERVEDVCRVFEVDVNAYAESEPEQISEEELEGIVGRSGKPVAASDLAFAYLDVGALQYMGTMPRGIEFEAWFRNFGESTMMYVVGENFAVYVSYNWTTLPEERYFRLPTLDGVIPETYCFAEWCAGPGPTPTPTGQAPTPTPGAAPGGPPPGGGDLVLVPWNQVNIFYDQDKPETGTVLARLELCAGVGFGCEPVQAVFDGANPLPIVNVIGPYPVFELPYGYSNNYTLQSTTFYANEVWVSDPTLRGITSP
jgi:hypothetical protein